MKRIPLIAGIVGLAFAITIRGETSAPPSDAVVATVNQFHEALRRGDGAAAMKLLAPDAVILESGGIETRAEYEGHHLGDDMAFAKAVPSTRSDHQVKIDDNTAWVTSRSKTEGSLNGKPINSVGAELVVLTKSDQGWQIRAIHWSSQKVTK